ncbi:MAG: hypothetical protein JO199_12940, partial [Candidatus Eremiobacteraeota bacterium]|nr:hypothetical protein [Candidatus Eremiobacteraeota bacterium]
MGRILNRHLAAVAAALIFAGATPSAPQPNVVSAGYERFGFALLAKLESANAGQNVFISPSSVAIALAMAANGASGTTRTAILATLGAQDDSISAFNEANRSLLRALHSPGGDIQFSVANAVWLNKSIAVEPSFVTVNHDVFGAT